MNLSEIQKEVIRKVGAVHRKSGQWFRAEGRGQRVTLASLWRKGVLVRRIHRKGKNSADDAHEYRLSDLACEAWSLPKSCEACGKHIRRDEHGVEDRDCDCTTCTACGKVYLSEDEDGPQVAKTDELAAKYGDGRCGACWRQVRAEEAKAVPASELQHCRRCGHEATTPEKHWAVPGVECPGGLDEFSGGPNPTRLMLEGVGKRKKEPTP